MTDQNETKSREIFRQVGDLQPSAFFAARVSTKAMQPSREVWFLRLVSALSVAAVIGLSSYIYLQSQKDVLVTYEPYVIQVDFNSRELKMAASAEVSLPDGIRFASRNEKIQSLRSLRLPVSQDKQGRLPFVVVSERDGHFPLEVKMYDGNDQLIGTKTITLHFEKKS